MMNKQRFWRREEWTFLSARRRQKVLLTDLLWEKNTVEWLADSTDKPKRTPSGQATKRDICFLFLYGAHHGFVLFESTHPFWQHFCLSPRWTGAWGGPYIHYGRIEISRVSQAFSSAKNRALGANLPRVLYSEKNCTRGREASPSVVAYLALREEWHS